MDKNVLMVVEAVANETGLGGEKIFGALEEALASVSERSWDEQAEARVEIDRTSGEYSTFRVYIVVDDDQEDFEPANQIRMSEARKDNADLVVGDVVEHSMPSVEFGRIAAHQAKQVLMRIVRDAERAKVARQFQKRIGELITGQIKRIARDGIIIELTDSIEAIVLRSQMIPRESVRVGDRLRGYLYEVDEERRGPQILLSRSHPEMLVQLFKIEVPEINEGVINIRACARDPGSRAKIAVKSNDSRIDPIGACVGMRGSRVQAVSAELGGERIDIVPWDDNPAQLVINAMAPAEVQSISINEETRTMDIAVSEDQLSQAIGRGGQNVRLAGLLAGWTLNVMTEEEANAKTESEFGELRSRFVRDLDVDEAVADILIREGYTSLDDISDAADAELAEVAEFDGGIAGELKERARDALLAKLLESGGDALSAGEPAEDLMELEGMTRELAFALAAKGASTRDDLADMAAFELEDIEGLTAERAAKLIMAARAHWFDETDNNEE